MAAGNAPSNRLAGELERIESSNIDERDKDTIRATIEDMSKATSTKYAYGGSLRRLAKYSDEPLTELSPAECEEILKTEYEEREWTDQTLAQYQSALKLFVEHRDGEEASEEIDVKRTSQTSSVDPRTVLSPDDFHAMRENANDVRGQCMVDLFGYTGQRLRVIQALKIRDVDVDEGVYYLPDVEGLKGADKGGKKRPLLGARKSVSDWLDNHPTGNPDDVLITSKPNSMGTPGEELSQQQISRILSAIADRAGVDKKVNPHAFRHFFVTVAKSQYDMDDGTIKHLIGHSPSSRIMETTYAHLSDDDHIQAAREALGMDTDDGDNHSLTPPVCPTCSTPLPDDTDRCPTPTCNETFSPDADDEGSVEAFKDGLTALMKQLGNDSDEEIGRIMRELAYNHEDEPVAEYQKDGDYPPSS